jgi:hypothetical protein
MQPDSNLPRTLKLSGSAPSVPRLHAHASMLLVGFQMRAQDGASPRAAVSAPGCTVSGPACAALCALPASSRTYAPPCRADTIAHAQARMQSPAPSRPEREAGRQGRGGCWRHTTCTKASAMEQVPGPLRGGGVRAGRGACRAAQALPPVVRELLCIRGGLWKGFIVCQS